MKFLTTVATAALILGSANAAFAARAYIGTYTPDPADPRSGNNNHGEGIYLVNIDDATGAPSNPKLVAKTLSPSWVRCAPRARPSGRRQMPEKPRASARRI